MNRDNEQSSCKKEYEPISRSYKRGILVHFENSLDFLATHESLPQFNFQIKDIRRQSVSNKRPREKRIFQTYNLI